MVHFMTQLEAWQRAPLQLSPHAPQLLGSLVTSTHAPLQSLKVPLQVH
jgi:hypothetical protein